ncbi:hypothetical protein [Pelagibacterium lentulum]|uniref:Uncharacterized protein n=1 Tax=Pelagibacterium lentulum TaxID=2029865 RepID=A0A916RAD2_9HYPH|nr:hypothetical protein [Pelagibacterium lentulum]GGA45832.1 hypothetical protein GCM10011499_14460 [Pelagibacterium lentulum]
MTDKMTDAELSKTMREAASWMMRSRFPGYEKRAIETAGACLLSADRLSRNQGVVTVKPLEWSVDSSPNEECRYNHCVAQTAVGPYRIEWKGWKDHDEPVVYRPIGDEFVGCFPTVLQAKAAAQADYERRILSALTEAPPAPSAAEPVEIDRFHIDSPCFPEPDGTLVRYEDHVRTIADLQAEIAELKGFSKKLFLDDTDALSSSATMLTDLQAEVERLREAAEWHEHNWKQERDLKVGLIAKNKALEDRIKKYEAGQ